MSVTSVAQEIVEIDCLFDAAARTEGKYRGFLESQARNRLKRLAIDAQSKLSGQPRPTPSEIQERPVEHEMADTRHRSGYDASGFLGKSVE